ncbi:Hypothetical protein DEACI_3985 [Acididesulfobacillus acetoxydans]|uniref:Uncharacterized protein n=1 Tax=Acididesulfobacillus acetoxydans TaxID=1561005 RepID=A0A8S0WI80_9FIRM|nr:Hypothetical protein DEACI_3985 [Acididesulfobacillus acetoxydans]CEJ07610.1 Hypothetical protein DEACI_2076 [Acididesulfobacillus acetoxydans]
MDKFRKGVAWQRSEKGRNSEKAVSAAKEAAFFLPGGEYPDGSSLHNKLIPLLHTYAGIHQEIGAGTE